MRGIAETLLAGPLKPTLRARGVYTIFPSPEPTGLGQGGGHTDTVCHPLCFMAYLADAPPRNGGFTLWPVRRIATPSLVPPRAGKLTAALVLQGSHRIMFRAHHTRTNWGPINEPDEPHVLGEMGTSNRVYSELLAHCKETITPWECCGSAGDGRLALPSLPSPPRSLMEAMCCASQSSSGTEGWSTLQEFTRARTSAWRRRGNGRTTSPC